MRFTDALSWGLRGMRQRRTRTALTVIGIMIGTAAVIALVALTQGISASINGEFTKLGPTTLVVTPSASTTLTQTDVNKISQLPNVAVAVPLIEAHVQIFGNQGHRPFTLLGVDPSQFGELLPGYQFAQGSLFQTISYDEIVAGAYVYQPQDLTSPFLGVGQSVTVAFSSQSTKLMVVTGVLQQYGATPFVSVDDSIFMPIQGLSSILGSNSYSIILVKATDTSTVSSVQANLKAVYGNGISITTVQEITQVVSTITGFFTVLLGGIAFISLLVAGIGIANIMFVSVIERTREIGALKALGFKSRDVLSIFLSEAALQGIIGGVLGVSFGVGLAYLLSDLLTANGLFSGRGTGGGGGIFSTGTGSLSFSPSISPEIILLVFSFAIAVSLIAGLYPSWRAAKMDPVVALRHE